MSTDFFTLFPVPSQRAIDAVAPLGFAAQLMADSTHHAALPASYLRKVIEPAFQHRQMKFYFNGDGDPVGYVIWVMAAPDVERRFLRSGQWNLHKSEWNEGETPWIIDFLVPYGNLRQVLRDLRDDVFRAHRAVRYARIKGQRLVSKEISRDIPSYFFRGAR